MSMGLSAPNSFGLPHRKSLLETNRNMFGALAHMDIAHFRLWVTKSLSLKTLMNPW